QRQHKTAVDIFWEQINQQVPHWKQLQSTPEFQDYLLEYDPILGGTKDDAMQQAQQELNYERVIAIFNAYRGPRPAQSNDNGQPPEPPITPDSIGGGGGPDIDEGPSFTESQVSTFYTDLANNKYRGREDEAQRIERDIKAAAQAGRITPG
ncbi:MAG TPA: hypothetical protein VKA19_02595, partial [Alphaproteobacteria bacterium]|nr:hypothetical protein [Alphaproteobacteria bacterium]